ncbi:MAG: hypothetical protein IKD07_02840, partial [Clostridia bacterium]|nr:hypothetical protein [Clostridia bacterium]
RVKIHAFDEREEARSLFEAMCPEILLDRAVDAVGDMRYTVHIHRAAFGTKEFYDALETVRDVTYLFVSLGSDKQNIDAVTGIKNLFVKLNCAPRIETIVYDHYLKARLQTNWDAEEIRIIGDLQSFYSQRTLIESDLEKKAIDVHKRWDGTSRAEVNFYMNDNNYYSSLASALHRNLRIQILEYTKSDRKKVFPFYYDEEGNRALKQAGMDYAAVREIFPQMKENADLNEISKKYSAFADCLYVKLMQIHFGKLSREERKAVTADWMGNKLKPAEKEAVLTAFGIENADLTKLAAEIAEACFERLSSVDHRRILRKLYDSLIDVKTADVNDAVERARIAVSFEYENLNDPEKADVRRYVCQCITGMNDELFYHDLACIYCFAQIEHVRWNAYTRTQGFRSAAKKNNPRKLHYNLVPVHMLTLADRIKDI